MLPYKVDEKTQKKLLKTVFKSEFICYTLIYKKRGQICYQKLCVTP